MSANLKEKEIEPAKDLENIAEAYVNAFLKTVPSSSKLEASSSKLESSSSEPKQPTIPRYPINFQHADHRYINPLMLSIGPYHISDDCLPMQDHKFRLLKSFLDRNPSVLLGRYIGELMSFHKAAWGCYEASEIKENCPFYARNLSKECFPENETHKSMDSSLDPKCLTEIKIDKSMNSIRDPQCFAVLLLLDGCFILELFFKWLHQDSDFLFTERRGQRLIFSELLLFANQIPFMVIQKLYDLVMTAGEPISTPAQVLPPYVFRSQLAKFLVNEEPTSHTSVVKAWPEEIHHLLDLYHKFLIATTTNHDMPAILPDEKQNHYLTAFLQWIHWPTTSRPDQQAANRPPRKIPCATELHEVGIKFRKKQSPKNLLDVTFSRGIFEIPLLQFDENKKILFCNLIALERQKNGKEQVVTSYIVLMDSLINTKADVELLQRAGIIHNMLPTHKEAAVFFNELGGSLLFDTVKHHFAKLFRKVQRYYDSSWNRSLARLFRDYCGSFWAILSVIAGLILLGLTALQTFYTVYPYYRPH